MITSFDKKTVAIVSNEIMESLESLSKRHGISIDRGNARYDKSGFRMTIEVRIKKNASNINQFARLDGIIEEGQDLTKSTLLVKNQKAKVIEYSTRSKKYTYIVELEDGSRYKLTPNGIKEAIL